jgi:hypothetical protein
MEKHHEWSSGGGNSCLSLIRQCLYIPVHHNITEPTCRGSINAEEVDGIKNALCTQRNQAAWLANCLRITICEFIVSKALLKYLKLTNAICENAPKITRSIRKGSCL